MDFYPERKTFIKRYDELLDILIVKSNVLSLHDHIRVANGAASMLNIKASVIIAKARCTLSSDST